MKRSTFIGSLGKATLYGGLAAGLCAAWATGCGGGGLTIPGTGPLFFALNPSVDGGSTTGGTTDPNGSFFNQGSREDIDPCAERTERKFVTITMRNQDSLDYIHYFFVAVAFIRGERYPTGGVCATDVNIYTQFGYTRIAEGTQQVFGDYCIQGPALVYFHQQGRFRQTGGSGASSLASAIAPARGASPTYDTFFTSSGARVPVPDQILLHNPGTGDGAALKVSRNRTDPCNPNQLSVGSGACNQDGFYYVDENDQFAGSAALGQGSGRRVPSEFQDTGCECLGFAEAFWRLGPSNVTATTAQCNEFARGGRIEFVYIRNDQTPPVPQLAWRVADSSGSIIHSFDPRTGVK